MITLGDKEYTLVPSVYAAQSLSRAYNGLQNVLRGINDLNFDVLVAVIIAGLGNRFRNPKLKAELEQLVFDAGISDDTGQIIKQCSRYLLVLVRGGRPVPDNLNDLIQQTEEANASTGGSEGNPPSSS
jgi:hypothetical protein